MLSCILSKAPGKPADSAFGPSAYNTSIITSSATVPADNSTTVTLTIVVQDVGGGPVAGITVVLARTGTGTLSSPAVTDAFGVTTATFRTSQTTGHVISMTINGVACNNTVTVTGLATGGGISLSTSTLTLAAVSADAGAGTVLATFTARDAAGVAIDADSETVVIGHTGGTSVVSISAVTNVGDGTYTATITPTTAGTATTMSVTVGGSPVTSSMPTFQVTTPATAWLLEDFSNSAYKTSGVMDITKYRANPLGYLSSVLYVEGTSANAGNESFHVSRISFDTGNAYGSSPASLKYSFPAPWTVVSSTAATPTVITCSADENGIGVGDIINQGNDINVHPKVILIGHSDTGIVGTEYFAKRLSANTFSLYRANNAADWTSGNATPNVAIAGAGGSGGTVMLTDYSIGVNYEFASHVTEFWAEVIAKFSADFTTSGPCTSGNKDYKFLAARANSGRNMLFCGTYGTGWQWGHPGDDTGTGSDTTVGAVTYYHNNAYGFSFKGNPWDGAWHTYRFHCKLGSGTGVAEWTYDGIHMPSLYNKNTSPATYYRGFSLGRNMNQGMSAAMQMWIGKATFHNVDPGWTFS